MIRYILNGEECNPKNRQEINYVLSLGKNQDKRTLELDVTSLVFVREDYTRVQTWRNTYGDYMGMPLEINYSDGTIIKYLLDFTDSMVVTGRSIECKLKRFRGWDMFFKRAEGLAWNNPNLQWIQADFRFVDYIIVPEDLVSRFISLLITIFLLAKEIVETTNRIIDNIKQIIDASTPVGGIPGPNYGAIVSGVLKLIANLAIAVALMIALIKLVGELIELIFPKIRQYRGITYKRLIEKGVNYLGYKLKSSVLDSLPDLVILPQPIRKTNAKWFVELFTPNTLAYTNGYPSAGDTIPTLDTALTEFEKLTNTEVRLIGDTVYIEHRDFFKQNANTTVQSTFNNQSLLTDEYDINASDQYKRLVVQYQVDPIDLNTYDDTDGSVQEVSSELINSYGHDYELLEGYTELSLPFARGTRKSGLNWFEKAVKNFAKNVDKFCNTSFVSKIEQRIGVMQISSQYFTSTKLLYMAGTKLHPSQNSFIGANKVIEYHASNRIENNQRRIYKQMPIAMTEQEMFSLLNNNFVHLTNGATAEISSIKWSDEDNVSEVYYTVDVAGVNVKSIVL